VDIDEKLRQNQTIEKITKNEKLFIGECNGEILKQTTNEQAG